MICPCCKYEPKYKKDGEVRSGYTDFAWLRFDHSCEAHSIWDTDDTFYVCPKCGVMFKEILK